MAHLDTRVEFQLQARHLNRELVGKSLISPKHTEEDSFITATQAITSHIVILAHGPLCIVRTQLPPVAHAQGTGIEFELHLIHHAQVGEVHIEGYTADAKSLFN